MIFLGLPVVWAVLTKVEKLKIVIGLDKDLSFIENNNLRRHFNPTCIQWKKIETTGTLEPFNLYEEISRGLHKSRLTYIIRQLTV